jgi:D-serine deaminase-like pyridoxal phosphate-dependent protein
VQHFPDALAREQAYEAQLDAVEEVLDTLSKIALPADIVSGGGTGTFDIDRRRGLLTECQPGAYAFMDSQYRRVALFRDDPQPFDVALFVQSTVSSTRHAGAVTLDAGVKCFATDGPPPEPALGAPPGATYEFCGDEFGRLRFERGSAGLDPGAKVEFVTPHCDPTVNLHDFYHCVRGDTLVDIWPVDARGCL